ncbi:transglycosylase domain-containing protein [Corynebacterium hansenii]|uniref:Transglycosylase domain-containing protein n=1 Tax=Corynebacterium hansenii TaxID=394964 RepID=A0ABV7ZMR6_9CORY|nr:Penicillin-binding protein 1A [Corynebacterium hansenii]
MSKDPRDNASGPGDPGSAGGEWWDVESASGAGRDGATGATGAGAAGASGEHRLGRNGGRRAGGPSKDDAFAGDGKYAPDEYGPDDYDADEYDAGDRIDDDLEDDGDVEEKGGRRRGIWAWLGVAAVLIILFPVAIFGIAYMATDVPEPEDLRNDQIAVIYDKTGDNEIARIVPEAGNRRAVNLQDVPSVVRNAVLAAEDREFYTNPGFSLSGYARAAWGVVTGNPSAGGGSTITQQYVKNAVVGNERTVTRKAKELVMSAKMAREWSKDEILEAYLNTIYFGRNGYGIAAAAEAYFGKKVEDLTAADAAVLAASIQRPSALDPWTNRAEAEQRWNYVLDGMVDMGVLTQADRNAQTYPETLDPALVPQQAPEPGPAAMIKSQVLAELDREGITEQEVNTLGLRVTTTIDPEAQKAALNAVDNYMFSDDLRAAIVSVEPKTGAVRAYYGGNDPNGWDYANSGLQTGSTFKIFALAAALDQDIPLSAQYSSAPVQSGPVTMQNAGGASCGVCPISESLKQSLNTPFIRLQRDLANGPTDTAKMAHRLGVAESLPGIERTLVEENGQSLDGIALGQYQSRPIDMAVGLGTLANDGVYQQTHFVEKVETVNGEVLFEREKKDGERRVSEAVATNVIDAMKPIASFNNHALAGGRPSAAKTGTTQLGDTGLNKDAWMIGATPQLSTAVWVGNVDGSALYNAYGGVMWGANTPSDLWKFTMDNALVNQNWENFSQPKPVNGVAGAPAWSGNAPPAGPGRDENSNEESSEESSPALPELPEIPPPGGGIGDLLPFPRPGDGGGPGGGGGGGNGGGGGGGGNEPVPQPAPGPAPEPAPGNN